MSQTGKYIKTYTAPPLKRKRYMLLFDVIVDRNVKQCVKSKKTYAEGKCVYIPSLLLLPSSQATAFSQVAHPYKTKLKLPHVPAALK
jgi:hypothetical protein